MANLVTPADYAGATLATAVPASALATVIPYINPTTSFPTSLTPPKYFYITLADAATGGSVTREVVKVTAMNSVVQTLTVVRGAGGYTIAAFAGGDIVDWRVCAQMLIDLQLGL